MAFLRAPIGTLNRRVSLQKRTTSQDAEGRPQEYWSTVQDIWAAISPLPGRETLIAAQAGEIITHSVTVRWRRDLASTVGHDLRLVERDPAQASPDRVLALTSVVHEDEGRRELQLLCRELQPA